MTRGGRSRHASVPGLSVCIDGGPISRIWDRVLEVHRLLEASGPGHQRSVSVPDLIVAAVAERHGATLVHYDADYDRLAALTGQPVRWVVPLESG